MKVLVTAGSTEIDIDLVRQLRTEDVDLVIGNGFKGATGEAIARHLKGAKHDVVLVTSNRDFLNDDILKFREFIMPKYVKLFRTYDELASIMEAEIRFGGYDAIIHSAAVSDYTVAGVSVFKDGSLLPVDNAKKISSAYSRLFLELVPTDKLIDKIRSPWGFNGKVVKFKLQVGISDEELIQIARKSMSDSDADLIVANCREWYKDRAYILARDGSLVSISRDRLAEEILRRLI